MYGSACGIPSHDEQKEVEVNLESDSDNENLDLSWGDEDMQFFFLKAPVAWPHGRGRFFVRRNT